MCMFLFLCNFQYFYYNKYVKKKKRILGVTDINRYKKASPRVIL